MSVSRIRFNPWRVFLVVATEFAQLHSGSPEEFQSLAGFLGRCDCQVRMREFANGTCFNPWRVFLVVATGIWAEVARLKECFNPWRVFLVVAT